MFPRVDVHEAPRNVEILKALLKFFPGLHFESTLKEFTHGVLDYRTATSHDEVHLLYFKKSIQGCYT